MSKYVKLENLIQSVSKTHMFNKDKLVFLNTSDVLEGKILINNYMPISEMKGQAKKSIQNGDILYSEIRPKNRRYAFVKNIDNVEDYVVSTKLMVLRNQSDKLDTNYLYHFLTSEGAVNYLQNRAENRIGSFPQITFEIIQSLNIYLPDLPIQQKIAAVLSALDDKIEVNNKINAELEAMAKTLYDYWFVQFEFPFDFAQGKPDAEGKPYKSSGGRMVYNSTLKREIPEGWEVSVFNNWIEKTKTGDWGKEEIEGNYTARVYCVRGADINGLNGKGEVKAPQRYILNNNLSKKLEENDFIIEISGGSPTQSTARIALLTKESFDRFDTDVVCSNFCKAVTLKNSLYAFNFQQEWHRLYDAGVFFGYEGKTSGIKNFLFDSFMESYHIVKPEENIVKQYQLIAKDLEKKRQINLKQNQELAQLRDWLLPMLMNGQVTVE
ncbi:restriction endonuclease subunit S [Empedobacter falsenii]|uniref:restriction endonuclease subunit S n=1 Tax=Empedobacter falsenii TaxID=343874 RepID=UPI00257522F6|nr:restriction endonuclease subunit S [Empedobacter falsenii]MDM1548852.1 restriction endonuclease subunit S [Empedobacter falsenii]